MEIVVLIAIQCSGSSLHEHIVALGNELADRSWNRRYPAFKCFYLPGKSNFHELIAPFTISLQPRESRTKSLLGARGPIPHMLPVLMILTLNCQGLSLTQSENREKDEVA